MALPPEATTLSPHPRHPPRTHFRRPRRPGARRAKVHPTAQVLHRRRVSKNVESLVGFLLLFCFASFIVSFCFIRLYIYIFLCVALFNAKTPPTTQVYIGGDSAKKFKSSFISFHYFIFHQFYFIFHFIIFYTYYFFPWSRFTPPANISQQQPFLCVVQHSRRFFLLY